MCGIVGIYNFDPEFPGVDGELISHMRDTMVHRGPDGARTWVSDDHRIGLGFRRLSIIDLSEAAMQPMSNEDGNLWIVFNGEIYNHAEIRKELDSISSHQWRTDHSDTEVILHAFEEWGIDCIHRFRGMFSIALWDAQKLQLWLIRDRIGIKPLYYSIQPGRISFASEIKALLRDPNQKRDVNEEALYHYLSFLTTPSPMTLFDGIQKLPGGTWLRINNDGEIRTHRYWDVWENTKPLYGVPDEEIAEMVIDELRNSVILRKVSDVQVGVFLSGGIDSSTNAALFSEDESRSVKTFSIGYEGEYQSSPNEFIHARKMANWIGADHYERKLQMDDLIEFLPRMIHLQDEPIADPVCVPVYYVSELARHNQVTVCQVGEGADELFWGYQSWKQMLTLQQYNNYPVPRSLKKLGLAGLRFLGKTNNFKYEWLRRGAMGEPLFWGGAEAFTDYEKMQMLSPRMREQFANRTSWEVLEPIHQHFLTHAWEISDLHWMTYLDLNLRLPELLLMRVDKMSMGVSLEARVPFLDHKLVELALSIPQEVKVRNGSSKYILKKAVRGLIPNELVERKKQGFGVPVYEWLFEGLGEYARHELDDFCKQTDFLDRDVVIPLVEQRRGVQAWFLLNFALWWKEYIK